MTPDQRAALRKLNSRNVARFHGGMRRAARATKKLAKKPDLKAVSKAHDSAMLHAERGEFVTAHQMERTAAMMLIDRREVEPSRSVLFRSAASLAMQAGKCSDAAQLARHGLDGKPPPEIREELMAVLIVASERLVKQKTTTTKPKENCNGY